MTRKKIPWYQVEETIQALCIIAFLICAFAWGWHAGKMQQERIAWLKVCAKETHGSLEREPDGESIYTNSDGHPTGSTVNWHYYVRTNAGRRIEYGDDYEVEK